MYKSETFLYLCSACPTVQSYVSKNYLMNKRRFWSKKMLPWQLCKAKGFLTVILKYINFVQNFYLWFEKHWRMPIQAVCFFFSVLHYLFYIKCLPDNAVYYSKKMYLSCNLTLQEKDVNRQFRYQHKMQKQLVCLLCSIHLMLYHTVHHKASKR